MVRSRYCGPARPRSPQKDWLLGGYKAESWSYDQSKAPPIYLRPTYEQFYYEYIDSQGYPFDLNNLDKSIDLARNPNDVYYDLNG